MQLIQTPVYGDRTGAYLKEMERVRQKDPEAALVLVVPDQYSYSAEKRLSEHFGGTGLNGIEVVTFRQMTRRFLHINRKKYLTGPGKQMLLYQAAKTACPTDSIFAASKNKPGFLDELYTLLCECRRYCVAPEALLEQSGQADNPVLADKLQAVGEIYRAFARRTEEGGFFDSEDDLSRVAEEIEKGGCFEGAYLFFDSFTDFLPQHYRVIGALMKKAAEVTFFITADSEQDPDPEGLFRLGLCTAQRLSDLADRLGISWAVRRLEEFLPKSPALEFLCKNYGNLDRTYSGAAEEIFLFEAREQYSEVERAALAITDLIREEGYRYGQIGVLCPDLDGYIPFIEPVFLEYEIPYFSDYKLSAGDHPIAMVVLGVFNILREGWSYDAMFRYLRTGLLCGAYEEGAQLRREDLDRIENHVLRRGIRGEMWLRDSYWETGEARIFDPVLGTYKTKYQQEAGAKKPLPGSLLEKKNLITVPLAVFFERTKKEAPLREHALALFRFMEEIHLYQRIEERVKTLGAEHPNESAQFARVWNLLMELLEQGVNTLGEEPCSCLEFGEYLSAGLSKCEIRIIPTGVDRVSVGTLDRLTLDGVRALFVLGANNGVLPPAAGTEGILSDNDRLYLEEQGLELAPDTKRQADAWEFKVYQALCAPSDRLYVSFPVSDSVGTALAPSQVVWDLLKLFPRMRREDNLTVKAGGEVLYLSSPQATMHRLLLGLEEGGRVHPLWEKVRRWYETQGAPWKEQLAVLDHVRQFRSSEPFLTPERALALYETYTDYSVSRLETYFVCPFRYFLENGLKAREREEWQVKSADLGDLIHWAIREYCMRVDGDAGTAAEKKKNWDTLTQADSLALIRTIMDGARERLGQLPFGQRKIEYTLRKVEGILKRSAGIVNRSFQRSRYSAAGYEWNFQDFEIREDGRSVTLHGVIDRVDVYEDEAARKAYIRVIDYKSGKKAFSTVDICNSLDLQLVVYAAAALEGYRSGALPSDRGGLDPVVKGIFYDKVHNDYVSCGLREQESLEKQIRDAFILEGMIYAPMTEKGKTKSVDLESLEDLDEGLSQGEAQSEYLKITLNRGKTDVDKRYSKVEPEENIEKLMEWVKHSILQADKEIKGGSVSPRPCKSGKQTGCDRFCPYLDICSFDKEKRREFRLLKDKEAAWRQVEDFTQGKGQEDGGETMDKGTEAGD